MIINLTEGDVRIGRYDADGAIIAWPETDVMGQPYEKKNATVQRVTGGFVVIAPDKAKDIEAIIVGQSKTFEVPTNDYKRTVKRADATE